MDDTQSQFDQAYWASQPPEIRALPGIADEQQRAARAADLAGKGFIIDVPIMVWCWDAYLAMRLRTDFGFTWVPSALQPQVTVAPGLSVPGLTPYDPAHPPPGSIRVSLTLADYPPFQAPAPPAGATPSGDDPVGPLSVGALYLSVVGDTYPDGSNFTDTRGTFLKHVTLTPFGRINYWEKIA